MDEAAQTECQEDLQRARGVAFRVQREVFREVVSGLGNAEAEHLVPELAPEAGETGGGDGGEEGVVEGRVHGCVPEGCVG